MALMTIGFEASFHDAIYGGWETPRNPNTAIALFAVICVLYILILVGFFLFGRTFTFRNEKIRYAFIWFILPNLALQTLIYYSYSIELMSFLNWFLTPLGNAFFFDTQAAYALKFSYFGNSILTYFPFIFAFLGGFTKRKKDKKIVKEKSENSPAS